MKIFSSARTFAPVIILLGIAAVWLIGIDKPFVDANAYNDACIANWGRNYLKLGLLETKLGTVWEINPAQPKPYLYYLHHPPLIGLLAAASFSIFGVHEWSARLVGCLASLGSLWLIWLIARQLLTERQALFSLLFAAFMPLMIVFGKMASHEPLTLFFCLLMLFFYLKYLKSEKYFPWLLAAVFGGLLSDWPAVYAAFLIYLHYYFWVKKDFKLTWLIALPVLFFLGWLVYSKALTGSFGGVSNLHSGKLAYQNLFAEIAMMVGADSFFSAGFFNAFFLKVLGNIIAYVTPPLALLSLYYFFSARMKKNEIVTGIFIFGLVHILLFPRGLAMVNPFSIYYLLPGFAISAALAFDGLKTLYAKTIILIIIFIFSLAVISQPIKDHDVVTSWDFGRKINLITNARDTIGIQSGIGPVIEFYADRYFERWTGGPKRFDYLLLHTSELGPLGETGLKNTPVSYLGDSYYLIGGKHQKLRPAVPRAANFADQITLTGYSFKRWPNFIQATYFWRIDSRPKENYMVFIHFEDPSKGYIFGQDHYFEQGLINLSRLNPGDKITETYFIDLPETSRQKELAVYLGIYSPVSGQRLELINTKTADNRLPLGKL